MNLYESIKSGSLKESKVTDYIDQNKLAQLIKKNSVLGKVTKSFKCLEGMILEITTDSGVSLYKVVNTPDGLEAYWIDKSGKQLADPFLLTEGNNSTNPDDWDDEDFKPKDEDWDDINHWYNDDPREEWDRQKDDSEIKGFDKEEELEKLHKGAWLTQEDIDWLDKKGYKEDLENILSNYLSTGNVEQDELNLNNKASDFFYDKAGIYNENIDSLCTKWAHDEAIKLNECNKLTESSNLFTTKRVEDCIDTFCEVIEQADDSLNEEEKAEEIQLGIQKIMNYCREVADYYKIKVESETDYMKLLTEECLKEAVNPENEKANELIRKALSSREDALALEKDLNKLGITLDKEYYNSKEETPENIYQIHLTGPNGRKLKVKGYSWDSNKPSKDTYLKAGINKYNPKKDTYENRKDLDNDFTLDKKSYKVSRDELEGIKQELPTLKRRLNLYERRYGNPSSQYYNLKKEIEYKENKLKQGITPEYNGSAIDKADLKNYLDKPFRSDRPQARPTYNNNNTSNWNMSRDAIGSEIDKANETSRHYKSAKAEERYNNKQKEWNAQRDKDDMDRIARYMKDYTEEKARRDEQTSKADEKIQKTLDEIRKKLDKSKSKKKGK